MDVKPYCSATSAKTKKPCPYRAKYEDPATQRPLCGIHYKMIGHHAPTTSLPPNPLVPVPRKLTPEPHPWRALGLPDPSVELRTHVRNKLRRRVAAGPRVATDGPGYIYAFWLKHEEGRSYWKIGVTQRSTPEDRMREWESAFPGRELCVKRVYAMDAPAAKFVERVIHLYLDHRRMYRYPMEDKRLLSVWSATGDVIEDADWKDLGPRGTQKPVAKYKMVEWFCIDWREADALIERVVTVYGARGP